jgi:hypothetical protein
MQRAIVLTQLPPLPDGSGADNPNNVFLLAMAMGGEADYVVTAARYRSRSIDRGWPEVGDAALAVSSALFRSAAPPALPAA